MALPVDRAVEQLVTEPRLAIVAGTMPPRGAILVFHGGKAHSQEPVSAGQLAVRRMRLFTRSLAAVGDDLVVVQIRFRVRGWNDTGDDVLDDVTAAIDTVVARFGDIPVVLVGHSMGGRAALRAAGHARVSGVVALAPWLPGREPIQQLHGRDVVVLHGTRDITTSPSASLRFVEHVAPIARRAVCLHIPSSGHAMVRRARTWHRLTAAFVAAEINDAPFDVALEQARRSHCLVCSAVDD